MHKDHKNDGFTLVEVIFAIVITLIGIFAVMSLSIVLIKGNLHSKRTTEATTIAQDMLEEAIRMGHDRINDFAINVAGADNYMNGTRGDIDIDKVVYNWFVEVQNDTPITDYTKTVTVEVWWGSVGSGTTHHSVVLDTILTQ